MNMKRTMTMLVLITALLVTVTGSHAELPAREPNIWGPVGDLVGTMNHGTVTMSVLDDYGFTPKYAEDTQLTDKYSGTLLFGWQTIGEESGNIITMRSYAGTGLDGRTSGHLTFGCLQPGDRGFSFDYRGYDYRYDTTSEMRSQAFAAGPMPPALAEMPGLHWDRARLTAKKILGAGFFLDAGFTQTNRTGSKGSLLRGATGSAVPGVKDMNTTTNAYWVRSNYARNAMAASLRFDMSSTTGNRALNTDHTYGDDRLLWNAALNASYDVNGRIRLLGGGLYSRLANDLAETYGGTDYLTQTEAKTSAGQLGVAAKVGTGTSVRVSGQFKKQDTEAQTYDDALAVDQAMIRDRESTLLQARVVNTSLSRTRLQLNYRYLKTDLDEEVAQGGLIGGSDDYQTTAQERKLQDIGLKLRYRYSRDVCLKAEGGYKKTEITESSYGFGAADGWLYKVGDRDIERMKWQIALGLRPTADLKIDLGHQYVDQTFERTDLDNVETCWKTQRGYVTANWAAMPRLAILASASLGTDKVELTDGPVATGTIGPLTYDGTTLRFAPGAVYTVNEKLSLEAIYEGVRFEDKGDAPDEGNQLNSDYDNLLVRVSYDVGERSRVTAAYRRQEFDENRWDDYIQDIYSLSVSGRF